MATKTNCELCGSEIIIEDGKYMETDTGDVCAVCYIEAQLTAEDLVEWHAGNATKHVELLVKKFGTFQAWGGLNSEPLTVKMV